MQPTHETNVAIETAFEHFNILLFDGKLPECLITLQRKGKYFGFFHRDRFGHATSDARTDEIALNPKHILKRPPDQTLGTLVHEMTHLWQFHFGKPSRPGYHNREWADAMERIGLMPSSTGAPGGKRTGQRVSHYIVAGGPFDRACATLLASGLALKWGDLDADDDAGGGRAGRRNKYTCPGCGLNAWAKPDARLVCGDCDAPMIVAGAKHSAGNGSDLYSSSTQ